MAKSEDLIQQVSHWVHDEQACVTVQRVVQTFEMSWSDALSLLKGIPQAGHQYSVIQFASGTPKQAVASTNSNASTPTPNNAFRLVESSLDTKAESDESSVWYALALEACAESIHTANERDSSQFRDGIEAFSIPLSLRPGEDNTDEEASEGFASSIIVSEAMKERVASSGKRKATDAFGAEAPVPPKVHSARIVPTKKTVTTARNFFSGNTSSSTKSKTKGGASSAKGTAKGKATAKAKHTSALSFQPKPKKVEGNQSSNGNSNDNNKATKPTIDEEKENVQNKASKKNKSSKVGNADEIVFDEESSDDEAMEEAPVRKPAGNSRQAAAKKKETSDDEDGDAPEKEETTKSKTNVDTGPKKRRRRKRLIEKTSTDENGYLFSETQAIWEDVPSEDEKELVVATSKATKQATKSKKSAVKPKMKQQSLMGFFAKKK